MIGKRIRQKGKIRLSGYFKKLNDNDRVAIIREYGVRASFPKRILGKSGKVICSRGQYKLIEIMDGNKTKTFIIHPVHLKKLN